MSLTSRQLRVQQRRRALEQGLPGDALARRELERGAQRARRFERTHPSHALEGVVDDGRGQARRDLEDDGGANLIDELLGVDQRAVEVEDDGGGHGARGGEWGREAARGEARDVDGVHGDAGVEQTAETLDWLVSQVARGARDGARDLAVGQTDAETRAKTVSRGFNRHGLIFVDEGSHALHDGLVEQILSVARGDDGAFGHGGDAARKLEERGGVAAVHGRRREDALERARSSRATISSSSSSSPSSPSPSSALALDADAPASDRNTSSVRRAATISFRSVTFSSTVRSFAFSGKISPLVASPPHAMNIS